jgi:dihydrofolate synthase/folylpolyglutamate synthase
MTYQQTVDFLYSQLPMFTRVGAAAYKENLHNTIAMLNLIGNPQQKFKSVHIAGTNGKGSTSHMLAAVFHANGYKTGLYTSPHLKDFRERIKVSDAFTNRLEMVSEQFVIDFTEKMKPAVATIEPSFFELTVALAFEYFAEQKVDIAIIETGLGGRLDSTNVIIPELSIITNIGWDHMNILGDTLQKIAFEKAGIIKQNIPVVIGETLPETKPVFESKALMENAVIIFAENSLIVEATSSAHQLSIRLNGKTYTTDLPGLYQQYNLRTALTAIKELQKKNWYLLPEKNAFALAHVKQITGLHGRWEVINTNPLLVIDVGHNEDGIKQVLFQIASMKKQIKQVHFITGIVKDKDVNKVLQLLPQNYIYYFSQAHIPRALPASELKEKATWFGLKGNCYDDVNEAIKAALALSSKDDLVLVCGSVFLAGEVDVERFKRG